MQPELKDIGSELVTKTMPAGVLAWWADFNVTAVLTCLLVVLQILYLLRKWWREESRWGLLLRHWAERKGFTKPADLDDEDM